jgi:hypothetical protein
VLVSGCFIKGRRSRLQGEALRENRFLVASQDRLDFTVVGEATTLEFREDEGPVLHHFEAAPVARNEQEGVDALLVLTEQLLRQTGGSRLIVSDSAVRQLDLQESLRDRGIAQV